MLKPIVGEFAVQVTAKNRIVVPVAWRDLFTTGKYYWSNYSGNYLEVFPEAYWLQYYEDLKNFSRFNPDLRDYLRLILSSTYALTADAQGRVVIPEDMLSVVNPGQGVVCLGLGDHFEVWSATAWQTKLKHQRKEIDQLAMRLALFEHKR